jgi:hypothetical protein
LGCSASLAAASLKSSSIKAQACRLADIYAYLQSMPKAPDSKSIPLLNP